MMKGCLLCVFGLPGSGKTSLIRELTKILNDKLSQIIIQFDAIVPLSQQALIVNEPGLWKRTRCNVLIAADEVISDFQNGRTATQSSYNEVDKIKVSIKNESKEIEAGKNVLVIVEDNLYYSSMRNEWRKLALKHRLCFAGIYLKTGVEECIVKNSLRHHNISLDIITRMATLFEEPDRKEFGDNLVVIESILNEELTDSIVNMIYDIIRKSEDSRDSVDLEEPVGGEHTLSSASTIHQLDCLARAVIREVVLVTQTDKHVKARKLSSAKKRLLSLLRSGKLIIPQWLNDQLCLETDAESRFDHLAKEYVKKLLLHYDPASQI